MPATTRTARALALALAGLGLTASTMTALPATAAGDGDTDRVSTTTTTTAKATQKKRLSAKRRVSQRVLSARDVAMRQRGDAYAYGAAGPHRFDCSGLMWAAYRSKGADYFQLPRVANDQYDATRDRTVDRSALLPGDLIFFNSGSHWSTIHHVGMYIGNGKMVHAPTSGDVVKVSTVGWTSFYRATRVFGAVKAPTPTPAAAPTARPAGTGRG